MRRGPPSSVETHLRIDDEQATECGAVHVVVLVGHQHAVRGRDGLGRVGDQRDGETADATVLPLGTRPRQLRVVAVGADRQHLRVDGLELLVVFREADDLRRAHEGEGELQAREAGNTMVRGTKDCLCQRRVFGRRQRPANQRSSQNTVVRCSRKRTG